MCELGSFCEIDMRSPHMPKSPSATAGMSSTREPSDHSVSGNARSQRRPPWSPWRWYDGPMHTTTSPSSPWLGGLALLILASSPPGCGRSSLDPRPSPSGGPFGDAAPPAPEVLEGQGAAGAPQIPCSGDSSEPFFTCAYVCSSCETDEIHPLVCRNGHMACPDTYVDDEGVTITVPVGMYVVGLDDYEAKSGQCAYRQRPMDAGLDPATPKQPSRGPHLRLAGCE